MPPTTVKDTIIEKLDYLVIHTGYTSRLLRMSNEDFFNDYSMWELDEDEESNSSEDSKSDGSNNKKSKSKNSSDSESEDGDKKSKNSSDSESEDNNKDDDTIFEKENIQYFRKRDCLFINDSLWGRGLYNISDDEKTIQEILLVPIDKVQDRCSSKTVGELNGTICFKVSNLIQAMRYTTYITSISYCGCLSMESMYRLQYVKYNDKNILIMDFDCESG